MLSLYYVALLERFAVEVLPTIAMVASPAHRVVHLVPTQPGFLKGEARPADRPLCRVWASASAGAVEVSLAHARQACGVCFGLAEECLQALGMLPDQELASMAIFGLASESVTGHYPLRFVPLVCDVARVDFVDTPGGPVQLELTLTDKDRTELIFPVRARAVEFTQARELPVRRVVAEGNDWRLLWEEEEK
jgi:hypothetical protein